jgi:primosomal replication protein N|tara:strand:+ start:7379 stop:7837 length:459 start_codon:yes stop_codon:yes gene_type:complete
MGTTTFSGPVKAGTIRETTGTTVGSDITNVGFVEMSQSKSITLSGASANTTVGVIPANSQITDVTMDVIIAGDDTNAATLSVGTSANGTAMIAATTAKTIARTRPIAAAIPALADVGTTDANVIAQFTATDGDGSVGEGVVTVSYIQNNSVT